MDYDLGTVNHRRSRIQSKYESLTQRILAGSNTSEGISDTVPLKTSMSKQQYQYLRDTQFSQSRYWREFQNRSAVAREEYSVRTLSTSTKETDTLTFVGNIPQSPNGEACQVVPSTSSMAVRKEEGLRFVGTITHSPDISQSQIIAMLNSAKTATQDTVLKPTLPSDSDSGVTREHTHPSTILYVQVPGQEPQSTTVSHQRETDDLTHMGTVCSSTAPSSFKHVMDNITKSDSSAALLKEDTMEGGSRVTREGVTSPSVSLTPTLSGATEACSDDATHSEISAANYTREEYVRMLKYHHHMASYYKELKEKTEHTQKVEASICPDQLQRKRVSVFRGSWDEPSQKKCWDNSAEDLNLSDKAIEELCAIPGVWDLAVDLGLLTICQAEEFKKFQPVKQI